MYIINSACISPQQTYDQTFFDRKINVHYGDRFMAVEPNYGDLIPAGILRRMGKAARMGVGAGLPLIKDIDLGGIILGTANGGLEDCLKFLNQIVDYEEGTLTPTNFVQSTPNAVAGSLALMSKTTGYNVTHVHKGLAFECALLDAMLLFQEQSPSAVLVGSVEEISDYNHNIDFLNGLFKTGVVTSENLFTTDTPGSVNGEGSTMFVAEPSRSDRTLAQIIDVHQLSYPATVEVQACIGYFLERNGLAISDIDTLILGISGDNRTDHFYTGVQNALFPESRVYTYKNLVGDYPTGSAFATWLGIQALSGKDLPEQCTYTFSSQETKNILIYNHYQGVQHGFILLRA